MAAEWLVTVEVMVGGARTNIVRVLPLEAHLKVMTLVHNVQEPVQELLALLLCHTVDVLDVATNREDALPSCHGIGSNQGMNGL